jgi:hypothetical protein
MQNCDHISGNHDKNTLLFVRTGIGSLYLLAIRRQKNVSGCILLRSKHVLFYFAPKTIQIYVRYNIFAMVTVTSKFFMEFKPFMEYGLTFQRRLDGILRPCVEVLR